METKFACAQDGKSLGVSDVAKVVAGVVDQLELRGKRLLCIVPDSTRTAPLGSLFAAFHEATVSQAAAVDVMIALGTHPPMSEAAILERMEWTPADRSGRFRDVQVYNHSWNDPAALTQLGVIPADEINSLSGGLFSMDV